MRIRRARRLQVEDLEGRILLSSATEDPSRSVQVTAARSPSFSGTLYVGFMGRHSLSSNQDSIFAFAGSDKKPFKPMGAHVRMGGPLGHAQTVTPGALPDLSGSSLSLNNARGSMLVTFSPSTTNTYRFTISGGTGRFATSDGITGNAMFTRGPHGFQIKFKSDNRGS